MTLVETKSMKVVQEFGDHVVISLWLWDLFLFEFLASNFVFLAL
jgi:hypothetical protein